MKNYKKYLMLFCLGFLILLIFTIICRLSVNYIHIPVLHKTSIFIAKLPLWIQQIISWYVIIYRPLEIILWICIFNLSLCIEFALFHVFHIFLLNKPHPFSGFVFLVILVFLLFKLCSFFFFNTLTENEEI